MSGEATWVRIATYASLLEAELAVQTLDAAGIPGITRTHDLVGVFGPGFQGATSHGVDVMVPSPLEQDAREELEPPTQSA